MIEHSDTIMPLIGYNKLLKKLRKDEQNWWTGSSSRQYTWFHVPASLCFGCFLLGSSTQSEEMSVGGITQ
jgi:hypothetical protein